MDGTEQGRKAETARIGITALRWDLTDIVDRVAETGARFVVTALGRPLVAIVSRDDLKRLEQLDAATSETTEPSVAKVA